jgi:branched-chain amino acid transport system permease protein
MLDLLLQLFIDGLTSGALYALMAVGFAMIYNGTRILHLAHGAVFTFGGYALYLLAVPLHLPLAVALVGAVVATACLGVLIDVAVYRPLRNRGSSAEAILVASIGVLTFFQAVYALVFGTDTLNLHQGPLPTIEVGDVIVTSLHIVAAVVACVVFPLLHLFLTRSRYGRAIRALADNPRLAVVRGIETERLYRLIFAIGSGLAGIAVVLVAYDLGVTPDMGFPVLFVALVAVIVGGVGYLPGAAAGGFLLGLLQKLSLWQLSGRWQDVIVFGALVLFLVFRPEGIFGHMLATRRV